MTKARVAVLALTGGGLSAGYVKLLSEVVPRFTKELGADNVLLAVPPSAENLATSWGAAIEIVRPNERRRKYPSLAVRLNLWTPTVIFHTNSYPWIYPGVPNVSMIQNMEMISCPIGNNTPIDVVKNLVRRCQAKSAVRQSDRMVAISHFVRDWLVDRWHYPADRIDIVPFGCNDGTAVAPAVLPHGVIPSRTVFTVGAIRPYRALEDAIRAFANGIIPDDCQLVIAGGVDPGGLWYLNKLKSLTRRLGLTERVHWLGHVDRDNIRWWMKKSAAFVMTSRVEACPNVALEAMSAGAKIVSASNPPLPEFFSECATYYRPGNHVALAERLKRAIDDVSGLHARCAAESRAKDFNWEATAEGMLLSLRKCTPQMLV